MDLSIVNFRSIDSAQFKIEGIKKKIGAMDGTVTITYIGASNYQGKTSLFHAVAAVMTGQPTIYPDMTKKNVSSLIKSGEDKAMAKVSDGAGSLMISWPDCTIEGKGEPISATPYALGLLSPVDFTNDKDRMAYFVKQLNAEPTRADLEKSLKDLKLPKEGIDKLMNNIKTLTWDGAHKSASEKGRDLKREWANITGEKYGSAKAVKFLPEGYEPELMKAKEEDLQRVFDDTREWVDAAASEMHVSDDRKAELTDMSKNITNAKKQEKAATAEVAKVKKTLQGMRDERDGLLQLSRQDKPLGCPACGVALHLKDGALIEVCEDNQKAVDDAKKRVTFLDNSIINTEKKLGVATRTETNLIKLTKECEDAKKELAKLKGQSKDKEINIQKLQEDHDDAARRLNAFKVKKDTDALHVKITKNAVIVDTLAPGGLRKKILQKSLIAFNKELSDLSKKAGWGTITIDDDLNIEYLNEAGVGVPFLYCSESEQYRVRATLQVYIALKESPPFIAFDRVDLLDKKGKNSLFNLVLKTSIPALLLSTELEGKESIAHLSKLGVRTYWLEKGGLVEA